MELEEWRPIKDFDNYHVSNLGNIKNIITNKTMKNCLKDGYYNISLVQNKIRKGFKVHRLVAGAFIPNPENKPEVPRGQRRPSMLRILLDRLRLQRLVQR
jgi:hypothetical protein